LTTPRLRLKVEGMTAHVLVQSALAAVDAPTGTVLRQWVTEYKIHPILVNFTAALIPVSVGSDVLALLFRRESLRTVAWWTLLYAAIITPLTSAAGWLFWMKDDNGVTGMAIHKWLGTVFPVLVVGLTVWRARIQTRQRSAAGLYMVVALALTALLVYQGHLGGDQVFSGP
jgi:uncharacterized membrane protein